MLERLQEIVRNHSGNLEAVITRESVLLTDIGLNSFELIDMLCEVEESFDIEISDRAISELKTVQDVLDYISAHGEKNYASV